jgi:hypothetical protein
MNFINENFLLRNSFKLYVRFDTLTFINFVGSASQNSKIWLKVWRFSFCEAIGTAATPGLLCQPRVIMKMIVEKQMKYRLAGEKPKFS